LQVQLYLFVIVPKDPAWERVVNPMTSTTDSSISTANPVNAVYPIGSIDDADFESHFPPQTLKYLALVSHNSTKQTMEEFVIANRNILKKFRLTGNNIIMKILKEVFDDDPTVEFGPTCKIRDSGEDSSLEAMIHSGQIGGCIFFIDPMDAYFHDPDLQCLIRYGNIHNIMLLTNSMTTRAALNSIRIGMKAGIPDLLPSFFYETKSVTQSLSSTTVTEELRYANDSDESIPYSAAPLRQVRIFKGRSDHVSNSIAPSSSSVCSTASSSSSIEEGKIKLRQKEEDLRKRIEEMRLPHQSALIPRKYKKKLRFNGSHVELITKRVNIESTTQKFTVTSPTKTPSRRRRTWRNWER